MMATGVRRGATPTLSKEDLDLLYSIELEDEHELSGAPCAAPALPIEDADEPMDEPPQQNSSKRRRIEAPRMDLAAPRAKQEQLCHWVAAPGPANPAVDVLSRRTPLAEMPSVMENVYDPILDALAESATAPDADAMDLDMDGDSGLLSFLGNCATKLPQYPLDALVRVNHAFGGVHNNLAEAADVREGFADLDRIISKPDEDAAQRTYPTSQTSPSPATPVPTRARAPPQAPIRGGSPVYPNFYFMNKAPTAFQASAPPSPQFPPPAREPSSVDATGSALCFAMSGHEAFREPSAAETCLVEAVIALGKDVVELYDSAATTTWALGSALAARIDALLRQDFMLRGPTGCARRLRLTIARERYTYHLNDGSLEISKDPSRLGKHDVALDCDATCALAASLGDDFRHFFYGVVSDLLRHDRKILPIDKTYPKWEIAAGQKSKGGLRSKTFFDPEASGAYLGNCIRRLIVVRGLDDANTRERFFVMFGLYTAETMRFMVQNIRVALGSRAVLLYDMPRLADVDVSSQAVEDIKDSFKHVHKHLARERMCTEANKDGFLAGLAAYLDSVLAQLGAAAEPGLGVPI